MSVQSVQFRDVTADDRWDPEFFGANFSAVRNALLSLGAVPLKEFVKVANRGSGPTYNPAGSLRVINSVNIRDLEFSDDRQAWVEDQEQLRQPFAMVRSGDLVVTSTGIGTLGRVFCNTSSQTYFADGHVTILRLHDPSLGPYLCSYLQSSLARTQFIQRRRGSSRQVEIYPEDILSVLVPVFLDQQAEISDEWMHAVEDVARARSLYPLAEKEVLEAACWPDVERLDNSIHFRSSLTHTNVHSRLDAEFFSHQNRKIESLLSSSGGLRFRDLEVGYVRGTQPAGYTTYGAICVIKSKDVLRTGINISTCDRASEKDIEPQQGIVQAGMLVMNMTGIGTLGRTSVVPHHKGVAVASVDVSGWALDTNILPVEYVSLFLNSKMGMAQTLRYQIGSSGQLHLYPEHVRNLWVFVKRKVNGDIDRDWHDELAGKVREASVARLRGLARLEHIQKRFSDLVGISPEILRE